ncbi:MAG: c-type cytochrome [Myxococcales bacterium]|jgi:mono/diheme cytochrome c family protein
MEQTRSRIAAAILAVAALTAPGLGGSAQADDKPDGKKVFEEGKCKKCHSAPGVKGGKHDLAGVGKKHDAKWMKAYLQKKEEMDGKKHKLKFKGSGAELDAVVKWLASLK